jgi:hypothetical protein
MDWRDRCGMPQSGVMLISGVWREKKEGRILLDEMK